MDSIYHGGAIDCKEAEKFLHLVTSQLLEVAAARTSQGSDRSSHQALERLSRHNVPATTYINH